MNAPVGGLLLQYHSALNLLMCCQWECSINIPRYHKVVLLCEKLKVHITRILCMYISMYLYNSCILFNYII